MEEAGDLFEDTFSAISSNKKKTTKKKNIFEDGKGLTADEHVQFQEKNPLINQLQSEALRNTFFGGEEPTTKKRGRPPKNPPSPKAPSLSNSSEKNTSNGNTSLRKAKQINALCDLYPYLTNFIPPRAALYSLSSDELEHIWANMREEVDSGAHGMGQLEYDTVKTVFFNVLGNFERICLFLHVRFGESIPFVGTFSKFPEGSFAEFVKLQNDIGQGVELELREISIYLIGLLPTSVWARLGTKLFYKLYDFQNFQKSAPLTALKEKLYSNAEKPIPEYLERDIAQMLATKTPRKIVKQ